MHPPAAQDTSTVMDVAPTNLSEPVVAPSRTVLCPGCGYDLRATTSERCSECGLVLDREALKRSAFPWAHRKTIGHVRAFLKTVWLVTSDHKSLRHETAKAQSARDALAFRRCVAVLLAVSFAIAVVMLVQTGALRDVLLRDKSIIARLGGGMAGVMQDLRLPWSAGVTIRPALFVYAFALAAYVAGATRPIFRTTGLSDDYAETVKAIGAYAVAPLAWLLPAAMTYALLFERDLFDAYGPRPTPLAPILVLLGLLFLIAGVVGTVHRAGQWRARTAHAGYPTGFLAMGELLLRWAVGVAVLGLVFPWCVGFVWIVVDSFRR